MSQNFTLQQQNYAGEIWGGGGVERDPSQICTFSAPPSKQFLKCLVRQWGNDRWQAKWVGVSTCQQTKVELVANPNQ